MDAEDDDDKVSRLPVRFKHPVPEERTLLRPYEVQKGSGCIHNRFVVDDKKAEVECASCGERLNPMWVLAQLTNRDARFHEAARRYQQEMKRLDERSRTKCRHCGQMTPISRN